MIPKKLWQIRVLFILLLIICAAMAVASFLSGNNIWFWVFTGLFAALLLLTVIRFLLMRRDVNRLMVRVARDLDTEDEQALSRFPLPVLVVNSRREILWYSQDFRERVLGNTDLYGMRLDELTRTSIEDFYKPSGVDVSYAGRHYTVYGFHSESHKTPVDILYFVDDTELKNTAQEYRMSRPCVMVLVIDNYEELLQNARESEKSQILGEIDSVIEQYFSKTNGFVQRFSRGRYLVLVEKRHFDQIVENRFSILDNARKISPNGRIPVTLSIGVGYEGATMGENEAAARQSLDMALGRGGDQAVVKTVNGYDFYGGVSKGIEKHTRVKSRIIATALMELVESSENIILMGHRGSDLDCVGSCIALAQAFRRIGKPSFIAIDRETSLARALIDKVTRSAAENENLFVHPETAIGMVTKRTVLIIVDTHNPLIVESNALYKICKNVVVIDHHRKMVNHIDNTVIFHHEPFASSSAEMVTELLQYFGDRCRPTREDAEALLSGIMLDTRNFAIRTGVRTFEAAAYLRRVGADTVSVRKLFSSTMEAYQHRTKLVQNAEVYRNCAIAVSTQSYEDIRIVASQAADELLGISDVDASFVIYKTTNDVSISARSLGELNVQIVMEQLGGGGHHTMAGVQIKDASTQEVKEKLRDAIDHYYSTLTAVK